MSPLRSEKWGCEYRNAEVEATVHLSRQRLRLIARSPNWIAGLGTVFVVVSLISTGIAGTSYGQNNPLEFIERTQILNDVDVSTFLGNPNLNLARTKDAEIADVNGDGYPDILDSNSNNVTNGTSMVLRLNDQAGGFDAIPLGPINDSISYDSDLVDLNGDDLPDLIRTEAFFFSARSTAIYLNRGAAAGWFDLANPDFVEGMTYFPDDIAYGDLNGDGAIDFAVTQRLHGAGRTGSDSSFTSVLINDGSGTQFTRVTDLPAPLGRSTHDVIFIDVEGDGDLDILTVTEEGTMKTRLFLNSGTNPVDFTPSPLAFVTAFTAAEADFNGDGLTDFALGGFDALTVYLNDATSPGSFIQLAGLGNVAGQGAFYDLEVGDVDNDGDIDIVGATILAGAGGAGLLWLNDGLATPGFVPVLSLQGNAPFPGQGFYQRMSADMIDFDADGDLDIYFAGANDQNFGCAGLGCVPNQFFENLTDPLLDVDGDGTPDDLDDCIDVANPSGVDADRDGIGNRCDGDLDQDGFVLGSDIATFFRCFGAVVPTVGGPAADATCEESDLDGDSSVTFTDFSIFVGLFNGIPGPSGLACADPTLTPPDQCAP